MPLKKIKKELEKSLKMELGKNPSTLIGYWFHTLKLKSIKSRINDIEVELKYRKTKK